MLNLPTPADAGRLRVFLTESGYTEAALRERLGTASPPTERDTQLLAALTEEVDTCNSLLRLFLLGTSIPKDVATATLPDWFLQLCFDTGLLLAESDKVAANAVIVTRGEFLIASDAFRLLATDGAGDFVLPASTHSANFLRQLILPIRAADALDLGCGCGIHALYMSLHCEQVVASDISERAVRFAEFNVLLNARDNVTCVVSDRFDALPGRSFDLIVSNPPFVPGPGDSLTYRDNPLELDEFCRELAIEASGHLNEGGHLQMLCEWVEQEGESWQDRVRRWIDATDCDGWVLHSPPQPPANYVAQRLSDIRGERLAVSSSQREWVQYFVERSVVAIHPGMIVLRKRQGTHWFHSHDLASDLTGDAGDAIVRAIAACDYMQDTDDAALLNATLSLSPYLLLQQDYARADGLWQPTRATLSLSDGMPMEAEVDMPVMAFLNQIDGKRTVADCVARFAAAANTNTQKIEADFLPIVRIFLGRGFLMPID